MGRQESQEYKERLKEMTGVLRKHNITRGVSPEKLRLILEDLGPTFIKLCRCILIFCQSGIVMS